MSDEVEVAPSKNLTLFNPAFIDDYGLTPEEFRVFARIMRRAAGNSVCRETIPNMAQRLGMSERSVRRGIRVLNECGAITVREQKGMPFLITFNPSDKWKPSVELYKIRETVYGAQLNKDRERKLTPVGNDTPCGNDRGRGVGNARGTPVGNDTQRYSLEGIPFKEEESASNQGAFPIHHSLDSGESRHLPPPLAEVFAGTVTAGLAARMGVKTLPVRWEWHKELQWAFANGFSAEHVLGCYDQMKQDKFWENRAITAKALMKNLPEYKKPIAEPKRPTARQMQAAIDAEER